MSVKNILAAYTGHTEKKSALQHTIKLAKLHDAWITGVISHEGEPIAKERFKGRLPKDILAEIDRLEEERVREIKSGFDRLIGEAGLSDKSDFIDLNTNEFGDLSTFARSFDLVVMGPHSSDQSEAHISAHPDRVALQSGRPILIVPNEYEADSLADHALVAWDGKRSAARALGDAMAYLETKAKVSILCCGKEAPVGVDQLLKCLERHGVEGDIIVKAPQHSIALTILETAKEIDAKLLVMGAYEHSKFAQDIFGGVTSAVMKDSPIPVFMSH